MMLGSKGLSQHFASFYAREIPTHYPALVTFDTYAKLEITENWRVYMGL